MDLKIYGEKSENVRLRLVKAPSVEHEGGVSVAVVDKNGDVVSQGYLLTFAQDGRIYCHPSVSPEFGFELEDDGSEEIVVRSWGDGSD